MQIPPVQALLSSSPSDTFDINTNELGSGPFFGWNVQVTSLGIFKMLDRERNPPATYQNCRLLVCKIAVYVNGWVDGTTK